MIRPVRDDIKEPKVLQPEILNVLSRIDYYEPHPRQREFYIIKSFAAALSLLLKDKKKLSEKKFQ